MFPCPQPVKINAAPKIPTAASAANHKAGGGNVEITNKKVVYNAGPKIPTAASAANHTAGGGKVKITNAPVKFNVAAKVPTAASAAEHKAGGGNVALHGVSKPAADDDGAEVAASADE